MNTHAANEPELGADFAARVLEIADRRLAQRRRLRWAFGASGVCLVIAATVAWNDFAQAPQPATPAAGPVLAVAPSFEGRADSTDALSYLFPDAEPLARFAAEDGGADRDEGAGALFDERD